MVILLQMYVLYKDNQPYDCLKGNDEVSNYTVLLEPLIGESRGRKLSESMEVISETGGDL